MVFSNVLLVFMMSLQFGMYGLMIDNGLQTFTGHMQIQAPDYVDDQKMRQTVPDVVSSRVRCVAELQSDSSAPGHKPLSWPPVKIEVMALRSSV